MDKASGSGGIPPQMQMYLDTARKQESFSAEIKTGQKAGFESTGIEKVDTSGSSALKGALREQLDANRDFSSTGNVGSTTARGMQRNEGAVREGSVIEKMGL